MFTKMIAWAKVLWYTPVLLSELTKRVEWLESLHQNQVHTIAVPCGMSTEQAWEFIRRGEDPTAHSPGPVAWTNVLVTIDGKLVRSYD